METNDPAAAADVMAVLDAETKAFWDRDLPGLSRETRILERRDGGWVIV